MARIIAASLAVATCAAAAAVGGGRAAFPCPAAIADDVSSTGDATQLVTVVAARTSSTRGTLQLWQRTGGCWLSAGGPWPAWLGRRGVSETRHEGDRTTPAGAFGFGRMMYGIAANPGVHYPYRRVVCGEPAAVVIGTRATIRRL